jgi:hypothetical protein
MISLSKTSFVGIIRVAPFQIGLLYTIQSVEKHPFWQIQFYFMLKPTLQGFGLAVDSFGGGSLVVKLLV